MAEETKWPEEIEFLDDPVILSFPFGDFKRLEGKLWTDPKDGTEKKLPDRYRYTCQRPPATARNDPAYWLKAVPWLHETIQRAGMGRGVTMTIRHRVNPTDKKKKYWEVVKDGKTFSSLENAAEDPKPAQEDKTTQEPPAEAPTDTGSTPGTDQPPHTADAPDPRNISLPNDEIPLRLMAVLDAAITMSRTVMAKHGITTEAEVCTSARGIYIDLNRNRWSPKPSRIEEMKALIKPKGPTQQSDSSYKAFVAEDVARHIDDEMERPGRTLDQIMADLMGHPRMDSTRERLQKEWQDADDDREIRKAVIYAAAQTILKG